MDFSALIADLRTIASRYNGKDTDRNVSTAMYCEMFRKILQKAENGVSEYSDQIVILWMTLSQLCNTYQTLTPCPARDSLYEHIFLLCAKVVLNIKWQQLPEDDQGKVNFSQTIANTHQHLVNTGFKRFELLPHIMENPWTDPTLSKIMAGDDKDDSSGSDTETEETEREREKKAKANIEEISNYIKKEDPLILKLRVEMLILENCEDFASNLCNCLVRYSPFRDDLDVREMQFTLLHKLNQMEKLQEECEQIVCHTGIKLINRLEQKEANQKLCVRLVQIFLVQDWINPDRTCCTKDLIKLWIRHQYMADRDRTKFLENVWSIAKISSKTEQIGVLVAGLQKECGTKLRQLYTDLCVYAINLDKGSCEKLMMNGDMEGVKEKQKSMSMTCEKLAGIVAMNNLKAAKISALTAFALNPTKTTLSLVEKMYLNKTLNQASERKKERNEKKHKDLRHTHDGEVNLATLYEVERLLNMLRPYYLNPDSTWQELQPVCKKFMLEKGSNDWKEIQKQHKEKVQKQQEEKILNLVKEMKSSPVKDIALERKSSIVKDGSLQYYCDDTTQFQQYSAEGSTAKAQDVSLSMKSPWSNLQSPSPNRPVAKESKLIPWSKLQNMSIQNNPIDMSKSSGPELPNQKSSTETSKKQKEKPSAMPPNFDFAKLLEATKNMPQIQTFMKQSSTPVPSQKVPANHSSGPLPYVPGLTSHEVQQAMLQQKKGLSRTFSVDQLQLQRPNSSKGPHIPERERTLSVDRNLAKQSSSNQLQGWASKSTSNLSKTAEQPRIIPQRPQPQVKSPSLTSFQQSFVSTLQGNQNTQESNSAQKKSFVAPVVTQTLPVRRSRQPSKEELQSIVDWLQTGTEDAKIKPGNVSQILVSSDVGPVVASKQKKQTAVQPGQQTQYVAFGSSPGQALQNTKKNQDQLKIKGDEKSKNFANQVMSKVGIQPGMTQEQINIARIKEIMRQQQEEALKEAQEKQSKKTQKSSKGFLLIPGSAHTVMQAKIQGDRTKLLQDKMKGIQKASNVKPQSVQNAVSAGQKLANQMLQTAPQQKPQISQTTTGMSDQLMTSKFKEFDIQHALQSLSKVLDKSSNVLSQNPALLGKSKNEEVIHRPARPASAMPALMAGSPIVATATKTTQNSTPMGGMPSLPKQHNPQMPVDTSSYQLLYLGEIKTAKSTESSLQQVGSAHLSNMIGSPSKPVQNLQLYSSNTASSQSVNVANLESQNSGHVSVQGLKASTLCPPSATLQTINPHGLVVGTGSVQGTVIQTLAPPSMTLTSVNSSVLPIQPQAVQNIPIQGVPTQYQQLPIHTYVQGQNNINESQNILGQCTVIQGQNLLIQGPSHLVQGQQTLIQGQNTIQGQGVNIQPIGMNATSVTPQIAFGIQGVSNQNSALPIVQGVSFQSPLDTGQTFMQPNAHQFEFNNQMIGVNTLPNVTANLTFERIQQNTAVTFTNPTVVMSTEISAPTTALTLNNQNIVQNVNNAIIPQSIPMATNAISYDPNNMVLGNAISPAFPLVQTGQTIQQPGNIVIQNTSACQNLNITSHVTVMQPFSAQPVIKNTSPKCSKSTGQPVAILPKTPVFVGPFKLVADTSTTTPSVVGVQPSMVPFSTPPKIKPAPLSSPSKSKSNETTVVKDLQSPFDKLLHKHLVESETSEVSKSDIEVGEKKEEALVPGSHESEGQASQSSSETSNIGNFISTESSLCSNDPLAGDTLLSNVGPTISSDENVNIVDIHITTFSNSKDNNRTECEVPGASSETIIDEKSLPKPGSKIQSNFLSDTIQESFWKDLKKFKEKMASANIPASKKEDENPSLVKETGILNAQETSVHHENTVTSEEISIELMNTVPVSEAVSTSQENISMDHINTLPITDAKLTSEGETSMETTNTVPVTEAMLESKGETSVEPTNTAPVTEAMLESKGETSVEPTNTAPVTKAMLASKGETSVEPTNTAPVTEAMLASKGETSVEPTNTAPVTEATLTNPGEIYIHQENSASIPEALLSSNEEGSHMSLTMEVTNKEETSVPNNNTAVVMEAEKENSDEQCSVTNEIPLPNQIHINSKQIDEHEEGSQKVLLESTEISDLIGESEFNSNLPNSENDSSISNEQNLSSILDSTKGPLNKNNTVKTNCLPCELQKNGESLNTGNQNNILKNTVGVKSVDQCDNIEIVMKPSDDEAENEGHTLVKSQDGHTETQNHDVISSNTTVYDTKPLPEEIISNHVLDNKDSFKQNDEELASKQLTLEENDTGLCDNVNESKAISSDSIHNLPGFDKGTMSMSSITPDIVDSSSKLFTRLDNPLTSGCTSYNSRTKHGIVDYSESSDSETERQELETNTQSTLSSKDDDLTGREEANCSVLSPDGSPAAESNLKEVDVLEYSSQMETTPQGLHAVENQQEVPSHAQAFGEDNDNSEIDSEKEASKPSICDTEAGLEQSESQESLPFLITHPNEIKSVGMDNETAVPETNMVAEESIEANDQTKHQPGSTILQGRNETNESPVKISNIVEQENDESEENAQNISKEVSHMEVSQTEVSHSEEDNKRVLSNDIQTPPAMENETSFPSKSESNLSTPPKNDLVENYKMLMEEMLSLSSTKKGTDASAGADDMFTVRKSFGFDELESSVGRAPNEINESSISSFSAFADDLNRLPESCSLNKIQTRSLPDDWAPSEHQVLERSLSNEERKLHRSNSDIDVANMDNNSNDCETQSVISDQEYQKKSLNNLQKGFLNQMHYGSSGSRMALPALKIKSRKPQTETHLLSYGEWKNQDYKVEIVSNRKSPVVMNCEQKEQLDELKVLNLIKTKEKEEPPKCKICLRTFDTMKALQQHVVHPCRPDIRKTVMQFKELDYRTVYTCNSCKVSCETEFAAKLHCDNCNGISGKRSQGYSINTFFHCKMCGESMNYQVIALEHVREKCPAIKHQEKVEKADRSNCWKDRKALEKTLDRNDEKLVEKNRQEDNKSESINSLTGEMVTENVIERTQDKVDAKLTDQAFSEDNKLGESEVLEKHHELDASVSPEVIKKAMEHDSKDIDNVSIKSFSTEASNATVDASETSSIKSGESKARILKQKQSARIISKNIKKMGKRVIKAKQYFGEFEVSEFVEKQAKKMNLKRKFKSTKSLSPKLRKSLTDKKFIGVRKKFKESPNCHNDGLSKENASMNQSHILSKRELIIEKVKLISKANITNIKQMELMNSLSFKKGGRDVFRCPLKDCRGPFNSHRSMMDHFVQRHKIKLYKRVGSRIICSYCTFSCSSMEKICDHSCNHFINIVIERSHDISTIVLSNVLSAAENGQAKGKQESDMDTNEKNMKNEITTCPDTKISVECLLDGDTKISVECLLDGDDVSDSGMGSNIIRRSSRKKSDGFSVYKDFELPGGKIFSSSKEEICNQNSSQNNHPDCKVIREKRSKVNNDLRSNNTSNQSHGRKNLLTRGILKENTDREEKEDGQKQIKEEKPDATLTRGRRGKTITADTLENTGRQTRRRKHHSGASTESKASTLEDSKSDISEIDTHDRYQRLRHTSRESNSSKASKDIKIEPDSLHIPNSKKRELSAESTEKKLCKKVKLNKTLVPESSVEEGKQTTTVSKRRRGSDLKLLEENKELLEIQTKRSITNAHLKEDDEIDGLSCTSNSSIKDTKSKKPTESKPRRYSDYKLLQENKDLLDLKPRHRTSPSNKGKNNTTPVHNKVHTACTNKTKKSGQKVKNTEIKGESEKNKTSPVEEGKDAQNPYLESFKKFVGMSKKGNFSAVKSLKQGKSSKLKSQAILHQRKQHLLRTKELKQETKAKDENLTLANQIEIKDFRKGSTSNKKVEVIDLTNENKKEHNEEMQMNSPVQTASKSSFQDSFLAHVSQNHKVCHEDKSSKIESKETDGNPQESKSLSLRKNKNTRKKSSERQCKPGMKDDNECSVDKSKLQENEVMKKDKPRKSLNQPEKKSNNSKSHSKKKNKGSNLDHDNKTETEAPSCKISDLIVPKSDSDKSSEKQKTNDHSKIKSNDTAFQNCFMSYLGSDESGSKCNNQAANDKRQKSPFKWDLDDDDSDSKSKSVVPSTNESETESSVTEICESRDKLNLQNDQEILRNATTAIANCLSGENLEANGGKSGHVDFEKHFKEFISKSKGESEIAESLGVNIKKDDEKASSEHVKKNAKVGPSNSAPRKEHASENSKKVTRAVSSTLDSTPCRTKSVHKGLSTGILNTGRIAKYNLPYSQSKLIGSKSFVVSKSMDTKKLIPISELNVINTQDSSTKSKPFLHDCTTKDLSNSENKTTLSQHKLQQRDQHRVRHMYHGGKVWQIGQGSVSSTSLASPNKASNSCNEHLNVDGNSKDCEKASRWKARKSPPKRPLPRENEPTDKKAKIS